MRFACLNTGFLALWLFVMNRNFLFFVSAIVLFALAACAKGDEEKAAAPADGQAASQPATPVEPSAGEKGPDLLKFMRENSGVMTPEEKAAAIERARANAETAAKAVGQSVEQVQAAGEAAAVAAQRLLEERQPQ
ncbi:MULTISPECIES: antifreeze protein [unclassified Brucella]|uniref:antifreeze protein n=1 Tax=unclassified Brucella TaxID=2632610 RepID=UPI000D02A7C0|nr:MULTISPECIES: antifreeze protein [unclassified Brucella]